MEGRKTCVSVSQRERETVCIAAYRNGTHTHTHTHIHTHTRGKPNQAHAHTHTSDEAKLCFECDGLEASSLSNLTGLWLRFRSETQLIYHAHLLRLGWLAIPPTRRICIHSQTFTAHTHTHTHTPVAGNRRNFGGGGGVGGQSHGPYRLRRRNKRKGSKPLPTFGSAHCSQPLVWD